MERIIVTELIDDMVVDARVGESYPLRIHVVQRFVCVIRIENNELENAIELNDETLLAHKESQLVTIIHKLLKNLQMLPQFQDVARVLNFHRCADDLLHIRLINRLQYINIRIVRQLKQEIKGRIVHILNEITRLKFVHFLLIMAVFVDLVFDLLLCRSSLGVRKYNLVEGLTVLDFAEKRWRIIKHGQNSHGCRTEPQNVFIN